MKVVIVTPTYNEKENVKILIPRLESSFKKIKNHDMHILVVDDNSPDNTADEIKKMQKKWKNIHLIIGEKKGLGVAYLRGFKEAIEKIKAEVVIMMDSDLSHPPEMIPSFIEEIESGYDLVVGSRYIRGGATPDWNFKRKIISRAGNFFARIVGGLYTIHDCTSGYRAIRVSILEKINTEHLHTRGYAFLSTLLYELASLGALVKEIPLIFYDRKFGQTKLKPRDMIEFFLNAFRLRFKSTKRMVKFAAVGSSGILINLGCFLIAKGSFTNNYFNTNTSLLGSSLIGDEISLMYNFYLNYFWTFKEEKTKKYLFKRFLIFHLIALPGILINNLVLFILYVKFGAADVLAKLIGIVVAFVVNYLINIKWTRRDKIE